MNFNWLEQIFEIFKYLIPGLMCLVGTLVVFRHFARRQEIIERGKIRMDAFATFIPLKLAAHERAILYLERIQPMNLIPRCEPNNQTAAQFKALMLFEIDAEYEHNVVQQLYITDHSWRALLTARNEIKAIIQVAFDKLPPKASGFDLAQNIALLLKAREEQESELTLYLAIRSLKSDIVQIFG